MRVQWAAPAVGASEQTARAAGCGAAGPAFSGARLPRAARPSSQFLLNFVPLGFSHVTSVRDWELTYDLWLVAQAAGAAPGRAAGIAARWAARLAVLPNADGAG